MSWFACMLTLLLVSTISEVDLRPSKSGEISRELVAHSNSTLVDILSNRTNSLSKLDRSQLLALKRHILGLPISHQAIVLYFRVIDAIRTLSKHLVRAW